MTLLSPPNTSEAPALFERHRPLLDAALAAIRQRTFWSGFNEQPSEKVYGEGAKAAGEVAFRAYMRSDFELDGQPETGDTVGVEKSPYGFILGIRYPKVDIERTIAAAEKASMAWRAASPELRVGVALEALGRLNARSFEMAFAVMHTTGQAFMMAFQAGGPNAQDRALEAIAYSYDAMRDVPRAARWEKPQGKNPPIQLEKRWRIVPRGIGLVIGVSTFPTWNGYPGLFASLVTGNTVVVKPHPYAVLPLAITVRVLRDVLRENGFDPNVVQLAVDEPSEPIAKEFAARPEIGIIDYTGSSAFGDWLEENVRHAAVYTEKAGVNSIVIDSTHDAAAMARNIAFSLALYSGQMCTTPQNLYIPRGGIRDGDGSTLSFDEVVDLIARSLGGLLGDDARAVEVLGAIAGDLTLARLEAAQALGEVIVASREVADARFPGARIRTPLLLKVDERTGSAHEEEQFGPVAFVVATANTEDSIAQAMSLAKMRGAITGLIYSTDPDVLDHAERAAAEAGMLLSCNLTGNVFVNQNAAFSDYHVSGMNPAGNASLTDLNFVAGRFRIAETRAAATA